MPRGRPKGSKNKPKVITQEQLEAVGQGRHRRGPRGPRQARMATGTGPPTKSLDDLLRPPLSVLLDQQEQPATDQFCPVSGSRQHYGYRGDHICWCTYCGRISQGLVFPERKTWD